MEKVTRDRDLFPTITFFFVFVNLVTQLKMFGLIRVPIALGVTLLVMWVLFWNKQYKKLVFRDEVEEPDKKPRLFGMNTLCAALFLLALALLGLLAIHLGYEVFPGYLEVCYMVVDMIYMSAVCLLFFRKLVGKND